MYQGEFTEVIVGALREYYVCSVKAFQFLSVICGSRMMEDQFNITPI